MLKLTDEVVAEARRLLVKGLPVQDVAARLKLSRSAVSKIKNGRTHAAVSA